MATEACARAPHHDARDERNCGAEQVAKATDGLTRMMPASPRGLGAGHRGGRRRAAVKTRKQADQAGPWPVVPRDESADIGTQNINKQIKLIATTGSFGRRRPARSLKRPQVMTERPRRAETRSGTAERSVIWRLTGELTAIDRRAFIGRRVPMAGA